MAKGSSSSDQAKESALVELLMLCSDNDNSKLVVVFCKRCRNRKFNTKNYGAFVLLSSTKTFNTKLCFLSEQFYRKRRNILPYSLVM